MRDEVDEIVLSRRCHYSSPHLAATLLEPRCLFYQKVATKNDVNLRLRVLFDDASECVEVRFLRRGARRQKLEK